MWAAYLVLSFHPATLVCHVSHWGHVSFRLPMDRGSTRSTWKAQLVPLRFYWSTKTHPVPPLLCCQFLLQTKSSKASQRPRRRLPLNPLFPRSAILPFLFQNWLFLITTPPTNKYRIATVQSLHTVGSCYVTPFSTFQVSKSAAAASAKLVPAAAAIQTVSSSGRNKWELQLGCHDYVLNSIVRFLDTTFRYSKKNNSPGEAFRE